MAQEEIMKRFVFCNGRNVSRFKSLSHMQANLIVMDTPFLAKKVLFSLTYDPFPWELTRVLHNCGDILPHMGVSTD